jgi:hypothetical protein
MADELTSQAVAWHVLFACKAPVCDVEHSVFLLVQRSITHVCALGEQILCTLETQVRR